MSMTTLIISRHDVARLVRRIGLDALMDEMIRRLELALKQAPSWREELPPRAGFSYTRPQRGLLEWMPYMAEDGTATIKIVSYVPANPTARGIPTVIGNIASYELETGRLLAVADGVFVTALRTGAASAIASRILARPDSRVLGLIGAGAQAVSQLHALWRTFPLERVVVYDIDRARAESFGGRAPFGGIKVEVATLDRVEREADILCTATSVAAREGPVMDGRAVAKHAHINAIGSDMPGKFELPRDLLERSLVCPDFEPQARVEGECQQLDSWTGPDLRTLVQQAERYVQYRDSLTVFDSTGFAFEDHVALKMLCELAREHGVGTPMAIENLSPDALNPYDFPAI